MTKLRPSRFKASELVRITYDVVPEHGTPFDDILKPEYWANVAQLMAPGSKIEMIAEDKSYFAELLVLDTGKLWAKVVLLRKVEFQDVEVEEEQIEDGTPKKTRHSIKWLSTADKYVVTRRNADGSRENIYAGFVTREAAHVKLAEHLAALSG